MSIKKRSEVEGLDDDLQAFDIIEDVRWLEVGKSLAMSYFAWVYYLWAIHTFKAFINYLAK
jgi:hypothetical protein|tara:strand:- start:1344 stop:1526 length:183 start_codon:yes stop_codon:yes gene_type:complete